jgi:polyhydroxyalkanoate synthesis repressor PhaR
MAASSNTDALQIRKYPNRRYYDTTHSRHVRLQDIRKAVRDGYRVCVRDSKTDDDITNQVLGQIVLSGEAAKLQALPPRALHALIRSSLPAWRETIRKMAIFTHALDGREWSDIAGDDPRLAVGERTRAMPVKEVLIKKLRQHVDSVNERIDELRHVDKP